MIDEAPTRTRPARWWHGATGVQFVVFIVAVAARLAVILRHSGGLHGDYGYDAGVYFGAADAFVHGRLPYRDFVLLHPPGLMLVVSPLASLTAVLSDESAFTLTVLAFTVLGGVNAVLVVRVVRRLDIGLRGAATAGLFYAIWFGSIGSEYLVKLEPVGNLFLLLGLLAMLRARSDGSLGWALAAGIAMGAAVSVKIWWIAVLPIVLCWLAWRTRSLRHTAVGLAGAALAALVIDGPFFIVAPRAMWSSVIQDQVSRGAFQRSPWLRLTDLSSLPRLTGPVSYGDTVVVGVLVLLLAVGMARRAWGVAAARPAVVLLVVQGVVLLVAPSWFTYYSDFVAVAGAIVCGAAVTPRVERHVRPVIGLPAGWLALALAAMITVPTLITGRAAVEPFPGAAALTRATRSVRCVTSDSPMGQIEVDALTRGLADGCRNWIDVTGRTYGPDRSSRPRIDNARWQRDLGSYLRSGGAVLLVRAGGTGVASGTLRELSRGGILVRAGGHTVYRVPRRS